LYTPRCKKKSERSTMAMHTFYMHLLESRRSLSMAEGVCGFLFLGMLIWLFILGLYNFIF
jgi:hypothetical protein